MHTFLGFGTSAKEPKLIDWLCYVLVLCSLFSRTSCDDVLLNRGGFIFERIVTNNLNQEFMSFTRQLDTEHLKPLIGNLQGLLQIHSEVCTRAKHASQPKLQNSSLLESLGLKIGHSYEMAADATIFIPKISHQSNSKAVCRQYDSRLPEYRPTIKDEIYSVCLRNGIYNFPVGIFLNPVSKTLQYLDSGTDVPTTLFDTVHVVDKGHTQFKVANLNASLLNSWANYSLHLENCHTRSPRLTYFHSYPSSKIHQATVCEKPHQFLTSNTNDVASQFLYQWVTHACTRDHPVLTLHVNHAIQEMNNIVNHQFTPKRILTYAQYFPEVMGTAGALSNSDDFEIQLFGAPTNFMQPLDTVQPKVKRDLFLSNSSLEDIDLDLSNVTKVSPQQFLQMINITEDELKQSLYESTKNSHPNETDIEYFILNHKLDTHANVTVHLVRDKRAAWFVIAIKAALKAIIAAVAAFFVVSYVKDVLTPKIDLGNTMINAEPVATALQLHKTNGQISKLALNQKEIEQLVNEGQEVISSLKAQMLVQTFAIATWAAQMDVKSNIQFGIQVLSSFILKLGSILLGAQSGKTSPFALNLKELAALQAEVADTFSGTTLSGQMSEIKTSLLNVGKLLQLQFTIPITSSETLYDIYKVIPIPTFIDNQTFVPNSPFTNIAIARNGLYYTTLSSEEFATCMGTPSVCNTHYPMRYLTTRFDCILNSYLNQQLTCPLVKTEAFPYPFLYFNDLNAVYSVPTKTLLRTTCFDTLGQRTDNTYDIEAIGNIKFKPNCKVTTTGDTYEFHYNTPKVSVTHNIAHWHTFSNIQFLIEPVKTYIIPPEISNSSKRLNLTTIAMPKWEDLVKEAFHPQNSFMTILHILSYAIPIIIIVALIRCLNNTPACTALKGAAVNRFTNVTTGANRWMHKRSADFRHHRDPPRNMHDFEPKGPEFMPLRPIQHAAMAHMSLPSTAHIPFTTDFLRFQQRAGNVHLASQNMYPNPAQVEDEYAHMEAGLAPEPPAYSSPPIIKKTDKTISKNNSKVTQKRPENRDPNSSLPSKPTDKQVRFDLK